MMRNDGLFIIISGPAGSGKDSILEKLLAKDENLFLSISNTTRTIRKQEVEGFHYRFLTKDDFVKKIDEDKMLEWAKYDNEFYGTERGPVEKKLSEGRDVVLEIEVSGALLVKEKKPEVIMVFIMPPSFVELETRLKSRGTQESDSLKNRLDRAKIEMKLAENYDYIVFNDKIDKAVCEINSIIASEKLRYNRMKNKVDEVLKNV